MEPGAQFDLQQIFAAAAQMQSQLVNAQQELADIEVSGTAGGGLVKATVNGQGELVDLEIKPSAIDPADPNESAQTIADLVLAAYRDARRAADELQQEKMGPLAARIDALTGGAPGIPGIPGLSGLPGLGPQPGGPAGGGGAPAAGQLPAPGNGDDQAGPAAGPAGGH